MLINVATRPDTEFYDLIMLCLLNKDLINTLNFTLAISQMGISPLGGICQTFLAGMQGEEGDR